eukprot:1161655-Pelagomonas_calceolata.AAC.2
MAVLDVQFIKLPGYSSRVVLLLTSSLPFVLRITRLGCEGEVGGLFGLVRALPLARSGQHSVRAAGVASSLIRNTGVEEIWRYYMIKDLLCDVHVMLGQTVCTAYIHMFKV